MMKPFNPCGGGLRADRWGAGRFGAPRGTGKDGKPRLHRGVDVCGEPGSYVVSPVDGFVVRTGKPYGDDGLWDCYLVIREQDGTEWRLFYVMPLPGIVGTTVRRGQAVATLVDVSAKYGTHPEKGRMRAHCHVERIVNGVHIDPEVL